MDTYLLFLVFGFAGLLIMAVLGAAGGHAHHHAHSADGFHLHGTGHHGLHAHTDVHVHHTPIAHAPHAGAAPSGAVHGVHAHGANGHATHSHGAGHHGSMGASASPLRAALLGWLSPRVAFTVALGFGATGALLQATLPLEPWRALASVGGGIALEKIVVAPLWNALLGFGSRPARTLESAVMEEAVALTNFDRDGCGLVTIDLDGHEIRVLGRLTPQHCGQSVRIGSPLLIESVDAARGTCAVSPLSPHV